MCWLSSNHQNHKCENHGMRGHVRYTWPGREWRLDRWRRPEARLSLGGLGPSGIKEGVHDEKALAVFAQNRHPQPKAECFGSFGLKSPPYPRLRCFGGFGTKPPRWMAPTVSPNLWVAISQFRLENRGKDPKASRGVTGKET